MQHSPEIFYVQSADRVNAVVRACRTVGACHGYGRAGLLCATPYLRRTCCDVDARAIECNIDCIIVAGAFADRRDHSVSGNGEIPHVRADADSLSNRHLGGVALRDRDCVGPGLRVQRSISG